MHHEQELGFLGDELLITRKNIADNFVSANAVGVDEIGVACRGGPQDSSSEGEQLRFSVFQRGAGRGERV